MIELPSIGGDVSLLEAGAAVAIFATGYVIHEVLHIIPLHVFGHDYTVEILPTPNGESKIAQLFFGTVVEITMLDNPPKSHVTMSALAPGVMTTLPLAALALAFAHPVLDIGTLLVIAAWFSVSIPSARDWVTVFQYEPGEAATEVNHG